MTKRFLALGAILAVAALAGCRDDGLSQPFYTADSATPTPTPTSGVTPTPTSSGGDSGTTMVSSSEQVTIVDFLTNETDGSVDIYVQRSDSEVWILTVAQSPTISVSETVVYQNANLIFGSTSGSILFPDGTIQSVIQSVQTQ